MAAAGPIRSQAERRSPTGRPAVPGRGFSLVELLVVLGIFMLLMGLSVAAIVSRPRTDAMVAAEQALGDAIRQARHTARTSGQPVVLRLKQAERQIAGLVREPLWHRLERWPQAENGNVPPAMIDWPGRTGTGLVIPGAYERGGVADSSLYLLPFTDGTADDQLPLRGGRLPWRGTSSRSSPVMLSVACKPPVADGPGGKTPDIIPIAMLIEDGRTDFESSIMGLLLVDTLYNPGTGVAPRQQGVAPTWEVLAWIGADADRSTVSSIQDVPAGKTRDQNTASILMGTNAYSGFAEAGPLVGGTWCELTLLYDGTRLVLYRNGERVGEKAGAPSFSEQKTSRILLGVAAIGPTAEMHPVYPSLTSRPEVVIDDVRLERLGDAMAGTLPNGIAPTADAAVTCHPDGRVEVAGVAGGTIDLTSPSGTKASITVDAMGGLTASRVTP